MAQHGQAPGPSVLSVFHPGVPAKFSGNRAEAGKFCRKGNHLPTS